MLMGLFTINLGGGMAGGLQQRVDRMGVWGAGLLGVVFALAFCPVSAGLFFGALIPMAVKGNSVLLSTLYGVGTALPVVVFALILAFAAHLLGTAFKKLTAIEVWVRRITAVVMIVAGVYLIMRHNFGVNF